MLANDYVDGYPDGTKFDKPQIYIDKLIGSKTLGVWKMQVNPYDMARYQRAAKYQRQILNTARYGYCTHCGHKI